MVTPELVKLLREKTSAGFADCKKALAESNGDMDKAVEILQKAGTVKAAKKADRVATEGVICTYVHSNNKIGVILEVNCETDFVARNDDFINFTKDVSLQIAAMSPTYVSSSDVPELIINEQRRIFLLSPDLNGKPDNIQQKIVDGKIKKWTQEICLMDQVFIKDPTTTISKLQTALTAKIGEKISVRRFVRYEVGEGLEGPAAAATSGAA